jgi:arabinogalactan oligomer/maltooligosaccharide transport system substrate-binding protein
MKKSLFVILSLVLIAAFALSACGGAAVTEEPMEETHAEEPMAEEPAAEPTEEPTEEVMFDTYITIWSDDMLTPVLLGFVDAFQAEYGIGLIVENVPDRNDQFPIAAPAGEGPDIIMLAHDRLGGFADSGLLAPIDLGDKAASFNPAALQAYTYGGQLVGVPYAVENMAFFYNTDMVEAAPTTWDEVMAVGGALVDAGDATYALALTGTTYDAYPLMTAFGGYIFGTNEDGSYNPQDVGIDSEGMIAAGDFIKAGVEAGYISSSTDWDTAHVQFETGEVPFLMAGPWALDRLRESGVPYAITNFPEATAVGAPFSGVQGFAVNALSENVLLAQAFLTEFLATDASMQMLAEGSNRPSAWLAVTSDDADLAAFGEIASIAQPMPNIPEMGSVWGSWGDATTLIINGEQEAAEAYGNAAAQIRDLIAGAAAGMVNVPGSWQAASGVCAGDWDPACEGSALVDNGDGTYSATFELAAGEYEGKVAHDGAWTENYGVDGKADGDNYAFVLEADGSVTFTYDSATHLLDIAIE